MSDPPRWSSGENGAPGGVRELLRHASGPRALDPIARARHARAVAKIAAGPAGASVALGGAKALLGGGVVAVLAAIVGVSTVRSRPAPYRPVAVVARPAASASAPVLETLPVRTPAVQSPAPHIVAARPTIAFPRPLVRVAPRVAISVAHVPVVASTAVPTAPVAPVDVVPPTEPSPGFAGTSASRSGGSGGPVDDLSRETNLLRDASDAVARDPRLSLALVERHEREFPRGNMAAEREWLAAQALRNMGRIAEARSRGEGLIARFPSSPYVQMTRRMLATLP